MIKQSILLCVFCVLPGLFYTQEAGITKVSPEKAASKLKQGNYEDALVDYLQLLNLESRNESYNYNVGVCYLNTNNNKAKAIPYLEIVTRKDKYNHEADYLLARAYHFAGRYDDAIKMYENYKVYLSKQSKSNQEVNSQIQYCQNAKELIKFPVDVTFQPLGNNINSEYNEYYPFVTANESVIYFNTTRPEKNAEKQENGQFGNSIYYSKVVDGQYTKALSLGAPVNAGNSGMEIIGLSAHGEVMLLSNANALHKANVFISYLTNEGTYSKPELLDKMINSGGDVVAASISGDGNTIYFTSNRPGGFGGLDLYSCQKLRGLTWAMPQNLGSAINTKEDEDFPNISMDGKTLYFSSKGHISMGGYDIFKAEYDELKKAFTRAKNIGYPVNTPYDDMNFRVSKNGKYGYIAAIKPSGLGEHDIYRVTFNEVEPDYTVVIGGFNSATSPLNFDNFFISVNDSETGELIGNYIPNPITGRYVMILTPGKYQMVIEAPGFKPVEKTIEVLDKASYQTEVNMNIELVK